MNNNAEAPVLLHVLSLEDSERDFEIVSEKLVSTGYNLDISRVENENDFTSSIQSNHYDIILADYNLPNFDAFQALTLCNKCCPEIPFICVSGSIGEVMAIELLKHGAVDYVLKDRLERLPFALKRALEEAKEKNIRKKAEKALQESEERLRDIIFSTADWVWEVDEKGKYTYSSQRGIELFDASHEEIIGRTPFDFMPEDEAKRVSVIFSKIAEEKTPIKDLENWNIGKDSKKICLLTNGMPILDSEGNLKGYRGVDKNITERKLAEEAIKQSEADLNHAQEIAKMGSWDYNFKTNKFKCSKNMPMILGCRSSEREITYTHFLDLMHPEDKYLIDLNFQDIVKTKNKVSFDSRYLLPNGEIIWTQNNISPIFENNELIELHGVNIDITEKKKAEKELIEAKEKAETSDRLKTVFINNISHEIRTPLNGILGFGEILTTENLLPEKRTHYLAILNKSSERLVNTVTNFMDISLLNSGNQEVFKKKIGLLKLINDVVGKFEELCNEKKLTISLQTPITESEIYIITDGELLSKIIYQLIDNAVKFTYKGGITVGYKISEGNLNLFVKDTGIGISEGKKNQIFENFIQENISNTRGYEGSGIGLSIAKGFAQLLSGTISLESEKGKGSTFYLSVPCKKEIDYRNPENLIQQPNNKEDKLTVLIAEDDDTNFFYLETLLKHRLIKILHAINGIEAVEICQKYPEVCLILMDLKMPEMDGFEATRQIKMFRNTLPILAITAYAGSEDKQRAMQAGCDEFITKPVKKEYILEKLEAFGLTNYKLRS